MGVICNLQFLPLGGSSADGTKTEKLELMENLIEKLELMSLRENKFRITSQSKRVFSSFSSFRTYRIMLVHLLSIFDLRRVSLSV